MTITVSGSSITFPDSTTQSTAFTGTGSTPNVQTFTSTGTWNKPSGCSMAKIQVWGGGQGGSRSGINGGAIGGAGGGYNELILPLSYLAASATATVGGGGAGATTNANGGTGGSSNFPINSAYNGITLVGATGGGNGLGAAAGDPYTNLAQVPSPGYFDSTLGFSSGYWSGGYVGQSVFGGGSGANGQSGGVNQTGYKSVYGGQGGNVTGQNGVSAGSTPGGGGAAPYGANINGAAGGSGQIVITCW